MKDSLRIIRVLNHLTDTENVSAFPNIIFNIFICAFIGKLSHFNPKKSYNKIDLTFQKQTVRPDHINQEKEEVIP